TADGQGGYEAMVENTERLGGGEPLTSEEPDYAAPAGAALDGSLYSQLTARQKAAYDVLESVTVDRLLAAGQVQYNDLLYRRVLVQIDGLTGTTMTGKVTGGIFRPSGSGVDVEKGIYTDLCAAIVALRYDRPDILWIGTMRYGYKVTVSGTESAKVTDVMFDFYLAYGGSEQDMREEMMARAKVIADQAAAAPDTYSKVLAVHDRLAELNVYGDTDEDLSHTAYSALISGDPYEPVCDGYSKAFKIICGMLEIPCVMPSSENHMWNNVKMENGQWYNVDLTWDDEGESVRHDYFLVGSQTTVGGTAFSQQTDHIEENPYDAYLAENQGKLLNPVTLKFPTKSTISYVYTGKDQDNPTFPDVPLNAWYYGAVEGAAEQGLFQGDRDGLFHPLRNITRAEFARVMANALNADLTGYGGSSYSDVSETAWYAAVVAWARDAGVMLGYGNGTFRPNAPITREEMCVVICQALPEKKGTGSFVFPDDADISSWAKESVYECYAQSLVYGGDRGRFLPKDNIRRCETATVCTKFVNLLKQ
ncbi:MAG: S-layer homology domain-containing protein, partial [Acutalibacter sp.]|nr:S-layer homology domain-containing protein [Acutalibacter sp.]